MPLNLTGTPSNFDCTGTGTQADPYSIASYNHGPNSSAQIIFTASEDGDIFVNLLVDSELTFDTASLYLGAQLSGPGRTAAHADLHKKCHHQRGE